MNGKRQKESGNALIYVLIAIALFAALSMTLGRQTDTSESEAIDDGKAELLATQLINYAAQAKSVVDQMDFLGNADTIGNLDFTLPTGAGFNTAPHLDKVYHPEGGGLNPASLPAQATYEIATDPPAGWYLGRFNNVEWTANAGDDVILVAYQIKQEVCEKINEKVTGNSTIPALTVNMRHMFIDDSLHSGTNADFTTTECAACDSYFSLCVSNNSNTAWSFYSIVADQ
jgi:hypothetical protein